MPTNQSQHFRFAETPKDGYCLNLLHSKVNLILLRLYYKNAIKIQSHIKNSTNNVPIVKN